MPNRFMAGNLTGAVTARCRTELGDLGLATDMARHPDLPNRGRSEVEYLCGGLYVTNGRSDRQFSIVIRIGGRAVRRIGAASIRAPQCAATGLSAG
jgi:hypothetical protein